MNVSDQIGRRTCEGSVEGNRHGETGTSKRLESERGIGTSSSLSSVRAMIRVDSHIDPLREALLFM